MNSRLQEHFKYTYGANVTAMNHSNAGMATETARMVDKRMKPQTGNDKGLSKRVWDMCSDKAR